MMASTSDVGQNLCQSFALAGTFHRPAISHKLDNGGQHALGVHKGDLEPLVGRPRPTFGLDGARTDGLADSALAFKRVERVDLPTFVDDTAAEAHLLEC
jgi:hypothetical protein